MPSAVMQLLPADPSKHASRSSSITPDAVGGPSPINNNNTINNGGLAYHVRLSFARGLDMSGPYFGAVS